MVLLQIIKFRQRLGVTINRRMISYPSNTKEKGEPLLNSVSHGGKLDDQGISKENLEAIISKIHEVRDDVSELISASVASTREAEKVDHFSLLQCEIEKLHIGIEKMRRELRYKNDKVTAEQHLDLNHRKIYASGQPLKQNPELANLVNKFLGDIHACKANIEVVKNDVIIIYTAGVVSLLVALASSCSMRSSRNSHDEEEVC